MGTTNDVSRRSFMGLLGAAVAMGALPFEKMQAMEAALPADAPITNVMLVKTKNGWESIGEIRSFSIEHELYETRHPLHLIKSTRFCAKLRDPRLDYDYFIEGSREVKIVCQVEGESPIEIHFEKLSFTNFGIEMTEMTNKTLGQLEGYVLPGVNTTHFLEQN